MRTRTGNGKFNLLHWHHRQIQSAAQEFNLWFDPSVSWVRKEGTSIVKGRSTYCGYIRLQSRRIVQAFEYLSKRAVALFGITANCGVPRRQFMYIKCSHPASRPPSHSIESQLNQLSIVCMSSSPHPHKYSTPPECLSPCFPSLSHFISSHRLVLISTHANSVYSCGPYKTVSVVFNRFPAPIWCIVYSYTKACARYVLVQQRFSTSLPMWKDELFMFHVQPFTVFLCLSLIPTALTTHSRASWQAPLLDGIGPIARHHYRTDGVGILILPPPALPSPEYFRFRLEWVRNKLPFATPSPVAAAASSHQLNSHKTEFPQLYGAQLIAHLATHYVY